MSSSTLFDLTGRAAIVTGASRGFGREIALQFARAGADLVLVGRDSVALAETRALIQVEVTSPKQKVIGMKADLANLDYLPQFAADCVTALSGVDVLVNNAAVQGPIGPFESLEAAAWRETFNTNFFAPAEFCRCVIPHMRKRGGGKIVNISGGGATSPRADFSAYATAKAALVRFSETIAQELLADKIDVNCVAPGAMNTQMLEQIIAAGPERARHEHSRALDQVKAGGTSPSVGAKLVLFLASSASDGITGRLLSAVWDDWRNLPLHVPQLARSDVFTLRRIAPADRGVAW